jgi:hypothetical protein
MYIRKIRQSTQKFEPVRKSGADEPLVVDASPFAVFLAGSVDQVFNDGVVEAVVNVQLPRAI